MRLIDPLELRDLFGDIRSVAIVGNAPSILESDNGGLIDSHDLIVRFNRARTAGLEVRIGSRTDVLVVNLGNSLARAPSPVETVRPRVVVSFLALQREGVRDFDPAAFRAWVGDCPTLFSYAPDLVGVRQPERDCPLTVGTYTLFMVLRLFQVQRLFVTGFTMFGSVSGGAGKYWNEALPTPTWVHDLDQEAKIFSGLLRDFTGQLTVTPDVRALAKQNGVTLAAHAASSGAGAGVATVSIRKRVAEALAWRLQRAGMALRRVAEATR